MAAYLPQSGAYCPALFQVSGQGTVADLHVVGHNMDVSRLLHDVTNTTHGGDTARIAGKRDMAGTINYKFDANYPPYLNPPDLVEGVSGVMLFNMSNLNRPIQIPVCVEKVHLESAVDSEVKGSCDVKMNSIAGLFIYPSV